MPNNAFKEIILVSMPWPLFDRPSIQLGTLKAYLKKSFPNLTIGAEHFFLKAAMTIQYPIYQAIAKQTWLAEPFYGALLYPDRRHQNEGLFRKEARKHSIFKKVDFTAVCRKLKTISDAFIADLVQRPAQLVGISISLCQLTSSLYLIRNIKKRSPDTIIAIGGSFFSGDTGPNFFHIFPEIDFLIKGEGERPLSQLVEYLMAEKPLQSMPLPDGVYAKHRLQPQRKISPFLQVKSLDALPAPDFEEYFQLLNSFAPTKTFFPTVPVEASRGCWWSSPKSKSQRNGCAFCNLNLQWQGYRIKDPLKIAQQVDHLTTRYQTLSVAFMDNIVPIKGAGKVFAAIARLKKDLHLFAELRASFPLKLLKAMRAAGMREVQVGIEALSSGLLQKLNKGTTVIQNMEIMKWCEWLGIANISNLIIQFPGSTPKDVEETLHNIEFAQPFRPLKSVRFWLGLESPVWCQPKAFGIHAVFNHPNYKVLFPTRIRRHYQFSIQAYRGDIGRQRKLWAPVRKRIQEWQTDYHSLHTGVRFEPIIGYRDGGRFLIIRQRRPQAKTLTHRLVGPSRAIYLFCETHRPLVRIQRQFPNISAAELHSFLKMMVAKRLIFEENDQFLSLGIPVRPNSH